MKESNEQKVRELVGPDTAERLIRYLDVIQAEQRKRGASPGDWRQQPWIAADYTNLKDIGTALDVVTLLGPPMDSP